MKIASIAPPHREPYQGWTPCVAWCQDHCAGAWRFRSEGIFEFDLESDYTMFMLRWA